MLLRCNTLGVVLVFALHAVAVQAGCSRPIVAPASAQGLSVTISGDMVSGVYPDLLRRMGKKYGCEFVFPVVPRARAEQMVLQSGQGDLLVTSTRSTVRDGVADFALLTKVRASLIFPKSRRLGENSLETILENRELRGAFVRSYSYGDQYNSLIMQLADQDRLIEVTNLVNVGKMLNAGRADFTIVTATLLASEMDMHPDTKEYSKELAYVTLTDLPVLQNGIYVSRLLGAADRSALEQIFAEMRQSGVLRTQLSKYYSPELIKATFVFD